MPSKSDALAEPLTRARDLSRVLADAQRDAAFTTRRTVDAAVRACEGLVRLAGTVESDIGRRAFTRELHRSWATVLEVREVLTDEALLRVFHEVEDALENVYRVVRRYEELSREVK